MANSVQDNSARPGPKLRYVRKPGTVADLQKTLWGAVRAAKDLLYHKDATFEQQIRAIHAITQSASAYAKLLETTDLQAEIQELRERLTELQRQQGLRKVS